MKRCGICALVAAAACCAAAHGALPIELEIAAPADAPFAAIEQWNKILGEMDLASVRLRGARAGDEPRMEAEPMGDGARYRIVGLLNRRDELVLPGGKFGPGDRAKLKQFLAELPSREAEAGAARLAFGLRPEQWARVLGELSPPFAESTEGAEPQELLAALTREVEMPVRGEVDVRARLRAAPPFRAQMKGLSRGTTLAALLRAGGLQFAPDKLGSDPLTLRVTPLDAGAESWPVGWAPAGGPRQVAPAMYRFTNIEIENYTLAKALEALAPHMGAPVVLDQRVIAARGIDLGAVTVKLPRGKTYIRRAVDAILAQGRLAGELRVDEAGTPFYWVTQFNNSSPRAQPLPQP